MSVDQVPLLWDREDEFRALIEGRTPAVFLDYDGTLTPIVEDYTQAVLSEEMRRAVAALARVCTVAIVSGRDLAAVRDLVGLDSLFYAGSHGFEIGGPEGWHDAIEKGAEALPALAQAERTLREELGRIPGHAVERKRFSIAIHYRRATATDAERIEQVVDRVAAGHPQLRKGRGKKVFRLQPDVDWDKGHAVSWLLERLGLDRPEIVPLYVGDDVTDEDAMQALSDRGIGIVDRGEDDARATAARYALTDCGDVRRFLEMLTSRYGRSGS